MKTYKINGREIQGFTGNTRKIGEYEVVEMSGLESKINELLEALSDENKCGHKKYGLKSDRRGVYCFECNTLLESKELK